MGFSKVRFSQSDQAVLNLIANRLRESGWKLSLIVVSNLEDVAWCSQMLPNVTIIRNTEPERGAISSLRLAISGMPNEADGLLAWPIDHPFIETQSLVHLREAATRANVAIPVHEGRRGHPTWWGRDSWRVLNSSEADFGANRILSSADISITTVEVIDQGVLINIDRPEDAARYGIVKAGE